MISLQDIINEQKKEPVQPSQNKELDNYIKDIDLTIQSTLENPKNPNFSREGLKTGIDYKTGKITLGDTVLYNGSQTPDRDLFLNTLKTLKNYGDSLKEVKKTGNINLAQTASKKFSQGIQENFTGYQQRVKPLTTRIEETVKENLSPVNVLVPAVPALNLLGVETKDIPLVGKPLESLTEKTRVGNIPFLGKTLENIAGSTVSAPVSILGQSMQGLEKISAYETPLDKLYTEQGKKLAGEFNPYELAGASIQLFGGAIANKLMSGVGTGIIKPIAGVAKTLGAGTVDDFATYTTAKIGSKFTGTLGTKIADIAGQSIKEISGSLPFLTGLVTLSNLPTIAKPLGVDIDEQKYAEGFNRINNTILGSQIKALGYSFGSYLAKEGAIDALKKSAYADFTKGGAKALAKYGWDLAKYNVIPTNPQAFENLFENAVDYGATLGLEGVDAFKKRITNPQDILENFIIYGNVPEGATTAQEVYNKIQDPVGVKEFTVDIGGKEYIDEDKIVNALYKIPTDTKGKPDEAYARQLLEQAKVENADNPDFVKGIDLVQSQSDIVKKETPQLTEQEITTLREGVTSVFKPLNITAENTIEFVDNILENPRAVGMFKDNLIKIVKGQKFSDAENTIKHEVFHLAFSLMKPEKRLKILELVKSKQNIETDILAEEWLANQFETKKIKQTNAIGRALRDIRDFFKKIIGKYDEIEGLFNKISEGRFKPEKKTTIETKFKIPENILTLANNTLSQLIKTDTLKAGDLQNAIRTNNIQKILEIVQETQGQTIVSKPVEVAQEQAPFSLQTQRIETPKQQIADTQQAMFKVKKRQATSFLGDVFYTILNDIAKGNITPDEIIFYLGIPEIRTSINLDTKDLKRLPYLSKQQANSLLNLYKEANNLPDPRDIYPQLAGEKIQIPSRKSQNYDEYNQIVNETGLFDRKIKNNGVVDFSTTGNSLDVIASDYFGGDNQAMVKALINAVNSGVEYNKEISRITNEINKIFQSVEVPKEPQIISEIEVEQIQNEQLNEAIKEVEDTSKQAIQENADTNKANDEGLNKEVGQILGEDITEVTETKLEEPNSKEQDKEQEEAKKEEEEKAKEPEKEVGYTEQQKQIIKDTRDAFIQRDEDVKIPFFSIIRNYGQTRLSVFNNRLRSMRDELNSRQPKSGDVAVKKFFDQLFTTNYSLEKFAEGIVGGQRKQKEGSYVLEREPFLGDTLLLDDDLTTKLKASIAPNEAKKGSLNSVYKWLNKTKPFDNLMSSMFDIDSKVKDESGKLVASINRFNSSLADIDITGTNEISNYEALVFSNIERALDSANNVDSFIEKQLEGLEGKQLEKERDRLYNRLSESFFQLWGMFTNLNLGNPYSQAKWTNTDDATLQQIRDIAQKNKSEMLSAYYKGDFELAKSIFKEGTRKIVDTYLEKKDKSKINKSIEYTTTRYSKIMDDMYSLYIRETKDPEYRQFWNILKNESYQNKVDNDKIRLDDFELLSKIYSDKLNQFVDNINLNNQDIKENSFLKTNQETINEIERIRGEALNQIKANPTNTASIFKEASQSITRLLLEGKDTEQANTYRKFVENDFDFLSPIYVPRIGVQEGEAGTLLQQDGGVDIGQDATLKEVTQATNQTINRAKKSNNIIFYTQSPTGFLMKDPLSYFSSAYKRQIGFNEVDNFLANIFHSLDNIIEKNRFEGVRFAPDSSIYSAKDILLQRLNADRTPNASPGFFKKYTAGVARLISLSQSAGMALGTLWSIPIALGSIPMLSDYNLPFVTRLKVRVLGGLGMIPGIGQLVNNNLYKANEENFKIVSQIVKDRKNLTTARFIRKWKRALTAISNERGWGKVFDAFLKPAEALLFTTSGAFNDQLEVATGIIASEILNSLENKNLTIGQKTAIVDSILTQANASKYYGLGMNRNSWSVIIDAIPFLKTGLETGMLGSTYQNFSDIIVGLYDNFSSPKLKEELGKASKKEAPQPTFKTGRNKKYGFSVWGGRTAEYVVGMILFYGLASVIRRLLMGQINPKEMSKMTPEQQGKYILKQAFPDGISAKTALNVVGEFIVGMPSRAFTDPASGVTTVTDTIGGFKDVFFNTNAQYLEQELSKSLSNIAKLTGLGVYYRALQSGIISTTPDEQTPEVSFKDLITADLNNRIPKNEDGELNSLYTALYGITGADYIPYESTKKVYSLYDTLVGSEEEKAIAKEKLSEQTTYQAKSSGSSSGTFSLSGSRTKSLAYKVPKARKVKRIKLKTIKTKKPKKLKLKRISLKSSLKLRKKLLF